jgi:hypothetical protein
MITPVTARIMVVDVVVRNVAGTVWSAEPIGLRGYRPGSLLAVSEDLPGLLLVHARTLVCSALGVDRHSFGVRFVSDEGRPCLGIG